MNGKTKFMWAVTLYHTQNTHGHWQVRMSFDACNHGLNTSFRLFCLFVTKEILYSIIAGSDHWSYAKPLLLHVFLTPRQALSSHPHQQMVWITICPPVAESPPRKFGPVFSADIPGWIGVIFGSISYCNSTSYFKKSQALYTVTNF